MVYSFATAAIKNTADWAAETTEIYFLIVLETEVQVQCQQVWSPPGGLSAGLADGCLLSVSSARLLFSETTSLVSLPLPMWTPVLLGLGPAFAVAFNHDYLCYRTLSVNAAL